MAQASGSLQHGRSLSAVKSHHGSDTEMRVLKEHSLDFPSRLVVTPNADTSNRSTGVSAPTSEVLSVREMHWRIAVEAGGGIWRGLLKSFRDKNGALVEAVALFTSPGTGTCLGLSVSQLNQRNVRKQIADSDALFAPYCERAATFILRNFNRKGMGLRALRKESEEVYTEVAG